MLPYVKKYVILACVIAVALPFAVSTVWPMLTGQMMAASIGGLVLMLALFFGGLIAGVRIMGRKADEFADGLIALYDEGCDPRAFTDAAHDIASSITAPFTPSGAWFLSYYAQALLDQGLIEKAEHLRSMMFESIAGSKRIADQVSIIVDLVPLTTKLKGPADALPVTEKGIDLIGASSDPQMVIQKDFLVGQAQIMRSKIEGELDGLAMLYHDVVSREIVPMRVRVESAWEEARIHFDRGDVVRERESLDFVVKHGGGLALVGPARARLADLSI